MKLLSIVAFILLGGFPAMACDDFEKTLTEITKTHLKGDLQSAIEKSNQVLKCENITNDEQIEIHLTIATIYDRIGLHENTRPHPRTLENIAISASLSDGLGPQTQAKINLSYAEFNYRAEMAERQFTKAYSYGKAALAGFETSGDLYGQSDAAHTLGLVHLQRREHDDARKYFNLSLNIERNTTAPRPRILADYDRHMGFILLREDKLEEALPLFENSYKIRRDNGLDDAALFAAQTYASTLINLENYKGALMPITYAIDVAERINSSYGKMISWSVLGRAQEQLGNKPESKRAYKNALSAAQKIGHENGIKSAIEGLKTARH